MPDLRPLPKSKVLGCGEALGSWVPGDRRVLEWEDPSHLSTVGVGEGSLQPLTWEAVVPAPLHV